MNLIVRQQIVIHQLRVENITNSSVLQIGSAGMIRSLADVKGAANHPGNAGALNVSPPVQPLVPLPAPTPVH